MSAPVSGEAYMQHLLDTVCFWSTPTEFSNYVIFFFTLWKSVSDVFNQLRLYLGWNLKVDLLMLGFNEYAGSSS